MNDEKDKWMEEVFQSMKGSERAMPGPELFAKIENQIKSSKAKIIPIHQWKYAIAAAVLILFVNVSALTYYNQQSNESADVVIANTDAYSQTLISTFQIYE